MQVHGRNLNKHGHICFVFDKKKKVCEISKCTGSLNYLNKSYSFYADLEGGGQEDR